MERIYLDIDREGTFDYINGHNLVKQTKTELRQLVLDEVDRFKK